MKTTKYFRNYPTMDFSYLNKSQLSTLDSIYKCLIANNLLDIFQIDFMIQDEEIIIYQNIESGLINIIVCSDGSFNISYIDNIYTVKDFVEYYMNSAEINKFLIKLSNLLKNDNLSKYSLKFFEEYTLRYQIKYQDDKNIQNTLSLYTTNTNENFLLYRIKHILQMKNFTCLSYKKYLKDDDISMSNLVDKVLNNI